MRDHRARTVVLRLGMSVKPAGHWAYGIRGLPQVGQEDGYVKRRWCLEEHETIDRNGADRPQERAAFGDYVRPQTLQRPSAFFLTT